MESERVSVCDGRSSGGEEVVLSDGGGAERVSGRRGRNLREIYWFVRNARWNRDGLNEYLES